MRPGSYRFQLLAPSETSGSRWRYSFADRHIYKRYLYSAQRLRARAYIADGAIRAWQVTPDGRFRMEGDDSSWHLALVDEAEAVIGCVRFLLHDPCTLSFEKLKLRHSALAKDAVWGPKLRDAVQADLSLAREHNFSYVELGGWAIAREYRHTKAAFECILASYAWAQLIGGCVCSCTATVRNGSALILGRIGGAGLDGEGQTFPRYMDPKYGCAMEILRFDSRFVPRRYAGIIQTLRDELGESPVVARCSSSEWHKGFKIPIGGLSPQIGGGLRVCATSG
ncbi:MAG TPA: hypothetical protein VH601_21360 [Bryobacteraceae bacterium]